MNNCFYCGVELEEEKFCSNCGAEVEKNHKFSQQELRTTQLLILIDEIINSLEYGDFRVEVDKKLYTGCLPDVNFEYRGFNFEVWYSESHDKAFLKVDASLIKYIPQLVIRKLWDTCVYSTEFYPQKGRSFLAKLLNRG